MKIEDGKGRGYIVAVDDENYLLTSCITQSEEHHANVNHQTCYNMTFQIANVSGLSNPFLYIKNNYNYNLMFEGLTIWSNFPNDGDNHQYVEVTIEDTGTALGGSSGTPVNLNAGSGKEADVTCRYGNQVTGITKGRILERLYVASGGSSKSFNFDQDIILPKNNTLCLYSNPGASGLKLEGTLDFYFHE